MIHQARFEAADAVRAAHHQIGNSLQSVASLLAMQGRSTGQPAASALMEASRRVGVIMRLHQRLQASADDKVCLDQLLGDICRDVAEISETGHDVIVSLDLEPMTASSKVASALGLIGAELVGNALEHAFKSREGAVWVALETTPAGFRLSVEDDGEGFTRGVGYSPGFGLSLVGKLTAQINGRMDVVSSEAGTAFTITGPGAHPDCAVSASDG